MLKNVVPVQINPKSKEDIKNIENKNIINETSADLNAKLDTKLIKDTSSLKKSLYTNLNILSKVLKDYQVHLIKVKFKFPLLANTIVRVF